MIGRNFPFLKHSCVAEMLFPSFLRPKTFFVVALFLSRTRFTPLFWQCPLSLIYLLWGIPRYFSWCLYPVAYLACNLQHRPHKLTGAASSHAISLFFSITKGALGGGKGEQTFPRYFWYLRKDFLATELKRGKKHWEWKWGGKGCMYTYRGADKSLAWPGRKQASVSVRMVWISFGALPYRRKKKAWHLASRCCWNLARPRHTSELVSFLVGLRTYQHPGIKDWFKRIFPFSNLPPKFFLFILAPPPPVLLATLRLCISLM